MPEFVIKDVFGFPAVEHQWIDRVPSELTCCTQETKPERMQRRNTDLICTGVTAGDAEFMNAAPQITGRGTRERHGANLCRACAMSEEPVNPFFDGGGLARSWAGYKANLG